MGLMGLSASQRFAAIRCLAVKHHGGDRFGTNAGTTLLLDAAAPSWGGKPFRQSDGKVLHYITDMQQYNNNQHPYQIPVGMELAVPYGGNCTGSCYGNNDGRPYVVHVSLPMGYAGTPCGGSWQLTTGSTLTRTRLTPEGAIAHGHAHESIRASKRIRA